MRRLLAVVGVLVLLLAAVVVADLLVRSGVERRATQSLETSGLSFSEDATVRIDGFPFLTQLLTGRLTQATLTADEVEIDGVVLTDVDAVANGVTTGDPYVAESVTLSATAPPGTLTDAVAQSQLGRLGIDLEMTVTDGRVVASTQILGLPVEVVMVPEAAGDAIGVGIDQVRIAGLTVSVSDLPSAVRTALEQVEVPLAGLPEGLSVTDVEVVDGGLRVTATGTDVQVETALPAVSGTP